MKTNIIRFPTEKCRLPGESLTEFNLRKLNTVEVPNIFAWDPPLIDKQGKRNKSYFAIWDPPLLDELAKGVQDSYPYP